jgi:Pyruvate/2-oxoacid:ferredoxin oxidoreductase gamma subunit
MIVLGAFVALTGIVSVEATITAMRETLPAHRQHLAERNVALLNLGAANILERAGARTATAGAPAGS